MNERYEGKSMLRLLELYVLNAIGHSTEKDEELLEKITPKISQNYNVSGSWKEIVQQVMELPDNMIELINHMWQKNQDIARQQNLSLVPEDFAKLFVDQNFV